MRTDRYKSRVRQEEPAMGSIYIIESLGCLGGFYDER